MVVGRDNQNQNSLTSIIGIFGDLGSKLDLLTKETTVVEDEPLNMAINNIEDLEKTLRLFQKEIEEEPNNEVIESVDEAVRGLTTEIRNQLRLEEVQISTPEVGDPLSILEEIRAVSDTTAEIPESSTAQYMGELVTSTLAGLASEDEDYRLTYIDLTLLLLFILGVFFIFFVFILLVSSCWRKMFGARESWKDLSDSETDSSVSWVSINTTTTEDTPVKPASQTQEVSTVQTVLQVQTDVIAPVTEQKILMVPGEFVLDRGTQWCRTEISPSIIV